MKKIIDEYKKIPLLIKLFLAVIIFMRILLFSQASFQIDMTAWQAWAARLVQLGPTNFYDKNIWTNYTPGYLLFLWVLGFLSNGIFQIPFFSSAFVYVIKLNTMIFDIATAVLIYKVLKENNKYWAFFGIILYLGNPAIIFNSSVWGQIDGILTFFILLSLYLVTEKNKPLLSSVFSTEAFLIKPQTLAVFPLYTLIIFQRFKSNLIKIAAAVFLIFISYSLLFFPKNIFFGLLNLVVQMTKDYSMTSLYAFNTWAILGWWQNDSIKFMGISYEFLGFVMYVFSLIVILVPFLLKQNKNKFYLYFLYSLSVMAFYLFPTRVHERYLLPFFAFFLIAAILKKSKFLLLIYVIVSIINFVNLWYVYYYYNFIYNNPAFRDNVFYLFINNNYKWLSAVLIFCFLTALIIYYRLIFYAKKI